VKEILSLGVILIEMVFMTLFGYVFMLLGPIMWPFGSEILAR